MAWPAWPKAMAVAVGITSFAASQLRSFALSRFQGMFCRITLCVHRITVAVADGRCVVKAFLGISPSSKAFRMAIALSQYFLLTLNNVEFP